MGNLLDLSSEDREPEVICSVVEIRFVPEEETTAIFDIYLTVWRDLLPCVKLSLRIFTLSLQY